MFTDSGRIHHFYEDLPNLLNEYRTQPKDYCKFYSDSTYIDSSISFHSFSVYFDRGF